MESDDDIYKKICRICLSYGSKEKMWCLTDNNSEDGLSCYGKSVLTFANISIRIDDKLPNFMCQKCVILLKQAIHFKLKCESSDKQLNEMIKLHKNCEELGTVKEAIVQSVMFSQSFPKTVNGIKSIKKYKDKTIKSTEHLTVNCFDENGLSCQDNSDDELVDLEHIEYDSADEVLDAMEDMLGLFPKVSDDHKKCAQEKSMRKQKLKDKKSKQIKNECTKENYTCKVCNKVYSNQYTYKNHMQQHNGYTYICEHCGKGFAVLAGLRIHLVARHGTGPHLKCQYCNFKAPKKFVLTEHERIHTGERPYTCDKCGLTFRRRALWRNHMIHHSEKTAQCPQCSRKFFTKAEVLAHFNNMHERMYMYACHKCDMTYAKSATVRRHLTEKHAIPREMQGKILRINKVRHVKLPEQ